MKCNRFVVILSAFVLLSGCAASSLSSKMPESSQIQLPPTISSIPEDPPVKEAQPKSTEEVISEAIEKWENLGGSYDFKSIDSLDLQTLIRIYSSHILYTGEYDQIMGNSWMDEGKVNDFAEDYFGLSTKILTDNLAPQRYDENKGFLFYPHASAIDRNAQYKLIDSKINSDGTYYFKAEVSFELPKELVPPGEEKVLRTIEVTFKYVDSKIQYLKASYQQNGRDL